MGDLDVWHDDGDTPKEGLLADLFLIDSSCCCCSGFEHVYLKRCSRSSQGCQDGRGVLRSESLSLMAKSIFKISKSVAQSNLLMSYNLFPD